ncbi:uncharacterized protein LMH87_007612 [Akanthomyces muscarius]|uniref:Uncharacterized protein n=1 Tax=Akanthomyces muscarius TaxID=2231603 RepID=A0A9W8QKK3_AKAMU|nr:uncharacterized protein LMH87_007612 [Akanthomyces muscarius]KAJ4161581.1 hypothetical protein LMH87_007612 [Akanthomyces muscarius]
MATSLTQKLGYSSVLGDVVGGLVYSVLSFWAFSGTDSMILSTTGHDGIRDTLVKLLFIIFLVPALIWGFIDPMVGTGLMGFATGVLYSALCGIDLSICHIVGVIVCCFAYNGTVPPYESKLDRKLRKQSSAEVCSVCLLPIAHSEKDERDGTMEAETDIVGVLTTLMLPYISAAAGYLVMFALPRNLQPHTMKDRLGPKWVRSLLGGYIFVMEKSFAKVPNADRGHHWATSHSDRDFIPSSEARFT